MLPSAFNARNEGLMRSAQRDDYSDLLRWEKDSVGVNDRAFWSGGRRLISGSAGRRRERRRRWGAGCTFGALRPRRQNWGSQRGPGVRRVSGTFVWV